MVEYSIIVWLLVLAVFLIGSTPVSLVGGSSDRSFFLVMLDSMMQYYDSFYLMLTAPFP